MKDRMSFKEMEAEFKKEKPWYTPNRINVGKFAKDKGYILVKQMVNKTVTYFYIKEA